MKYIDFRNNINKPIFSRTDIHLRHLNVYDYQLTLWLKKKYIERIKKGLYVFVDAKHTISPENISFYLYSPSYISLESALSYYGFIPEMVFSYTAITTKTTRNFHNTFGHFLYRSIHPNLFFGYRSQITKTGIYLIAEPEKAILDYLYFHHQYIKTMQDLKQLRLNEEELKKKIDCKKLEQYGKEYRSQGLHSCISLLTSILC